jgi:hypothetical protein
MGIVRGDGDDVRPPLEGQHRRRGDGADDRPRADELPRRQVVGGHAHDGDAQLGGAGQRLGEADRRGHRADRQQAAALATRGDAVPHPLADRHPSGEGQCRRQDDQDQGDRPVDHVHEHRHDQQGPEAGSGDPFVLGHGEPQHGPAPGPGQGQDHGPGEPSAEGGEREEHAAVPAQETDHRHAEGPGRHVDDEGERSEPAEGVTVTTGTVRPIDVLIAGAQRAGSTSLVRYLAQHPDVAIHDAIEFPYFVVDHVHADGYPAAYRRFYDDPTEAVVLAKSAGVLHRPEAVSRAIEVNPDLRFVVLLRDPAARAVSAYGFARMGGQEPLDDIVAALGAPADRFPDDPERQWITSYIARSRYAAAMARLFDVAGRDRVLPVRFDDLTRDPETTCRSIYGFMGVDPDAVDGDYAVAHNPTGQPRSQALGRVLRIRNRTSGVATLLRRAIPARMRARLLEGLLDLNRGSADARPEVPPEARALVIERCRDDVEELERMLDWDLHGWLRP